MAFDWRPYQSQALRADGRMLEAMCLGHPPSESPTIILLHEGLGCVALWRDFPEALSEATGCGVFLYSRAGYGQSDPVALPRPLDYMTREATLVLPGIIDAVGADNVILLGHSDGATIAAIHAGLVSDPRVQGLVLMAPHFFAENGGLASIRKARVAYDGGDLRARLAKYHADPDVAFRGWCDAWLDPGFASWNVAHVLDALRVPTLAIQGDDDQYGTRAQVDEVAARSPETVTIEMLPDCGHSPHLERPAVTLSAISRFVVTLGLGTT